MLRYVKRTERRRLRASILDFPISDKEFSEYYFKTSFVKDIYLLGSTKFLARIQQGFAEISPIQHGGPLRCPESSQIG